MSRASIYSKIAPAVTVLAIIGVWHLAAVFKFMPSSLLPYPADAISALFNGLFSGSLWPHIATTLGSALAGYLIAFVIGIGLAALMTIYPAMERFLLVYVNAFQAIPKVSLAPLIFVWVGTGISSSIFLVALASLYTIFLNTYAGLRSTSEDLLSLYRVFNTGRFRTFFSLRLPFAAPHIFVGLELGVVFALMSAVVMEFVAGSSGLGYLIALASSTLNSELAFASLILLAIIGVVSTRLVRAAGSKTVFWHQAR